jgi:hypothetical protein
MLTCITISTLPKSTISGIIFSQPLKTPPQTAKEPFLGLTFSQLTHEINSSFPHTSPKLITMQAFCTTFIGPITRTASNSTPHILTHRHRLTFLRIQINTVSTTDYYVCVNYVDGSRYNWPTTT